MERVEQRLERMEQRQIRLQRGFLLLVTALFLGALGAGTAVFYGKLNPASVDHGTVRVNLLDPESSPYIPPALLPAWQELRRKLRMNSRLYELGLITQEAHKENTARLEEQLQDLLSKIPRQKRSPHKGG